MIFESEHEYDLEYDYEDDHPYDGEYELVGDADISYSEALPSEADVLGAAEEEGVRPAVTVRSRSRGGSHSEALPSEALPSEADVVGTAEDEGVRPAERARSRGGSHSEALPSEADVAGTAEEEGVRPAERAGSRGRGRGRGRGREEHTRTLLADGREGRAERSDGETGAQESRAAREDALRSTGSDDAVAVARGAEGRAERSDGETGATSGVFGTNQTTEGSTRRVSRSAKESTTPENPGGAGGCFFVRSESREALQASEREMKKSRAAREDALRSTGSDDAVAVARGAEGRAERSDGETGATSGVFGTNQTTEGSTRRVSRSAGETEAPENPGGAGGCFFVRSESREALQASEREMKKSRAAREDALRSTGSDDAVAVARGAEGRAERSDGETGATSGVFGTIRSRSAGETEAPENPGGAGGCFFVRSESREALQASEREMKKSRAAREDALRSTGSDDASGGHDV